MRTKSQTQDGQTAGLTRWRNLCAALGLGLFYLASKMIQAQWPPLYSLLLLLLAFGFSMTAIWQHKDLSLIRRAAAKERPKQEIHV